MLDGLGKDLTTHIDNSNKFFKNGNFSNVWSNAEWTLPSFSNLISGTRTSTHGVFEPNSNYSNYFNIHSLANPVKMNKRTIFEYFKNLGFVTSSFSAYDRINPSYNFNKGVDIFKYSKNHTAEEIIEDIIGQIEMFKNNSNFIYAHIFDTHSPAKNFHRISEFAGYPSTNYNFDKENKDIDKSLKKAIRIHDKFESVQDISSFKTSDRKLSILYNYLHNLKLDDFTILLFGDHGTRLNDTKKFNVLSKRHNNIGFCKDKKIKNFKNKNNFVELIDVLPSLLFRYSKRIFKAPK